MSWNPAFIEPALHYWFGVGTPLRPTDFWLAQHSGPPGQTGANEVTGNAANRVQVIPAGGSVDGIITFSAGQTNIAGPDDPGSCSHVGVWSAETGGQYYFSGAYLDGPFYWNAGQRLYWNAGDVQAIWQGINGRWSALTLENCLLWLLNVGQAPTRPISYHVSQHYADPGDTGGSEFGAQGGYGRSSPVAFAAGVPADGRIFNADAGSSPTSTGAWDNGGAVSHFGIFDAPSGGNYLGGGEYDQIQVIDAAGQRVEWMAHALVAEMHGVGAGGLSVFDM